MELLGTTEAARSVGELGVTIPIWIVVVVNDDAAVVEMTTQTWKAAFSSSASEVACPTPRPWPGHE